MADYTQVAADIRYSGAAQLVVGLASGAIAAGAAIAKDSNGRWALADADAADADDLTQVGIAVHSAPAAGQPLLVCTRDTGLTPGFTLTLGTQVYVSGTAGGWMPGADLATGDAIIPCMTPTSTTQAIFDPAPAGKLAP